MAKGNSNIHLDPDEQPKSGVWADVHDVIDQRTNDDEEEGNAEGMNVMEEPDE